MKYAAPAGRAWRPYTCWCSADVGKERGIIGALEEMPGVEEVRGTYGVYDVFCKIRGETRDALDSTIAEIRRISRIRSTVTLHWIPSQGGKG